MRMKMPQVGWPDWKWYFEGEKMRMLRWILGIVLLGVVVALLIVFWPTILQAGQRCIERCRQRETDALDEVHAAA